MKKNKMQININQHIYLISNEEVRKGDWCVSVKDPTRMMSDEFMQSLDPFRAIRDMGKVDFTKRIDFTTDPRLIADGVPAMPESMLPYSLKKSDA